MPPVFGTIKENMSLQSYICAEALLEVNNRLKQLDGHLSSNHPVSSAGRAPWGPLEPYYTLGLSSSQFAYRLGCLYVTIELLPI